MLLSELRVLSEKTDVLEKSEVEKFKKYYQQVPTSKFLTKELIKIAKNTGHKLFDSHPSGLTWAKGEPEIKETNMLKRLEDDMNSLGADDTLLDYFEVGTFEFVFFPSTPKKAFDASGLTNLLDPKLIDKDGNIYLMDNTDSPPLLSIIKPNFVKKDFNKAKKFLQLKNS